MSFGESGSNGLHDVSLCDDPDANPDDVWRSWSGEGIILVVARPTNKSRRISTNWYYRHGEIELCGSGAVALAGLLLDDAGRDSDVLEFAGRFHDIRARKTADGVKIRLPNVGLEPASPGPALVQALRLDEATEILASKALRTYVVCLKEGVDLRRIEPDFDALKSLELPYLAAVIITSLRAEGSAFTFRYFTPWHGLNESPTAASANSLLGRFWMTKSGESELTSIQQSLAEPQFRLDVGEEGTWLEGRYAIHRSRPDDAVSFRDKAAWFSP